MSLTICLYVVVHERGRDGGRWRERRIKNVLLSNKYLLYTIYLLYQYIINRCMFYVYMLIMSTTYNIIFCIFIHTYQININ